MRSSSLIWLAVTLAGLSNVSPGVLAAFVRSASSDSLVTLRVPTEVYSLSPLSTKASPRASISDQGEEVQHRPAEERLEDVEHHPPGDALRL